MTFAVDKKTGENLFDINNNLIFHVVHKELFHSNKSLKPFSRWSLFDTSKNYDKYYLNKKF